MNITSMLPHKLVYWPALSKNGYGEITFDAPIEKVCRWEDKQEEVAEADGTKVLCQAVVYTKDPLEVDGLVLLTTLDSLTNEQKLAPETTDAHRVKVRRSMASVSGSIVWYKHALSTRLSGR